MKNKLKIIMVFIVCAITFLTGCLSPSVTESNTNKKNNNDTLRTVNVEEFERILAELPLYVSRTNYVVQDDQYKTIYPDMLQAFITNNTSLDIKNAVIAFVGWDENDLPVKLKGQFDFTEGSYIKKVNCTDINLIGGDTFGKDNGYSLADGCEVARFKAIVVSLETFEGKNWSNPYYNDFCKLYEGKKYSDDLKIEIVMYDNNYPRYEKSAAQEEIDKTDTNNEVVSDEKKDMTVEELEQCLSEQPITIINTKYVIQDDTYKALYPDMLQAILQNNSDKDIKSAVVAFVAWDKNNLPIKLKGQFDFLGGTYVKEVNYSDINLVEGETYGEGKGYSLSEEIKIGKFKAIIVSYETFEGETWYNPYYEEFRNLYEGKKLNE